MRDVEAEGIAVIAWSAWERANEIVIIYAWTMLAIALAGGWAL
jgi:hypothetical protein